jgi:hypothetical protein
VRDAGCPAPAGADPRGEFYTFEKGVEKTGGGKGFADIWCENHFAFEYKGKHKELGAAYRQRLQYRESLSNPQPLDFAALEVGKNKGCM